MGTLSRLYGQNLSLLTDLYQLTMAYGYWVHGRHELESVFHLTFRRHPFKGGYTIAAGLEYAIEFLQGLRFEAEDLTYLGTLTGVDEKPLFSQRFLEYLETLEFRCDLDAMPEGSVAFPNEPLLRVRGPLLQAQLIETPLLNMLNFQSLIATKSARVCLAAGGDPVLEFGLRRAQGIDGGLAASRAAYIGGCDSTSNVLAGKLFGIPVKGTHAHSWIMSFGDEREAFEAYADAMPNNCIFLVDTYDTLEGVARAVEVGRRLRARGHRLVGVRLDSGDLAYLSRRAREILDEGGFPDARIVASNDLNEHLIEDLKHQGARIQVWGVGTQLSTAYDQPALGGVYKLGAIRNPSGEWEYKVKLSEQAIKISTPGILQVLRYSNDQGFAADMIVDELHPPGERSIIVDPLDPTRRKHLGAEYAVESLLVPVFRGGTRVYTPPPLTELRARASRQLQHLHEGIKRLTNPHQYPVGLEQGLYDRKTALILRARGEVV